MMMAALDSDGNERVVDRLLADMKNGRGLWITRGWPAMDRGDSIVDGGLSGPSIRKVVFAIFARFPDCALVLRAGTRASAALVWISLWRVSVSSRQL